MELIALGDMAGIHRALASAGLANKSVAVVERLLRVRLPSGSDENFDEKARLVFSAIEKYREDKAEGVAP